LNDKEIRDLFNFRLECLLIIKKLLKVEIGDSERLEKMNRVLEDHRKLSDNDLRYLREKNKHLALIGEDQNLIDDEEEKKIRVLKELSQLEHFEIGDPKRLKFIRSVLLSGKLLSISDDNYFQDKLNKLEKIEPTLQKNSSQVIQEETQFWVCPHCGGDTQSRNKKQFCSKCNVYL